MSLSPKTLIALAAVLAMALSFFLPFLSTPEGGLSLFDLSSRTEGTNFVFLLSWLLIVGLLACALADDVSGLVPLAVLYCVYPTYAFHNAAAWLGEVEIHYGFPPFAGDPAGIGYYLVFIASYAAIAVGFADHFAHRRRIGRVTL